MNKNYLYVIIAGIFFGTIVSGGQFFINLGFSFYEVAIFPLLFSLLILPLIIIKKKFRLTKGALLFFTVFGLVGAVIRLSYFLALRLGVPVAIVVFLAYTQPFWTVFLSKLFLDEKITKYKIVSLLFVLVGLLVIVAPTSFKTSVSLLGIIVALVSGISNSGWVIYSRKGGLKHYDFATMVFFYSIFTIFFLFLSYFALSYLIKNPQLIRLSFNWSFKIWSYLFIFALASSLIPLSFLFKGVEKVQASTTGIILLLEPVTAAILGIVVIGQPFTFNILIGGILILLSNYFMVTSSSN